MDAKNKLAILSILCLPLVSSAAIGTYYVSPSGSDDSDGKSWATAFATPNKGFDVINESANRGSHLWIDSGEYALTKAIGVNGGSTEAKRSFVRSRTGNPKDVVLYSNGTFECLRIGGHIQVSGITFSNGVNRAGCAAGGIRFAGVKPTNAGGHAGIVSNCIVTCCQNIYGAGTNGAAVAMFSNDLMIDSIIRNNTATSWRGGGVLLVDYDRNERVTGGPTIKRCRIEGNSANSDGAGVYVSNYAMADVHAFTETGVNIEDCEIVGNTAANGAGLFCATNMTVTMMGCIVSNNVASSNSGGFRLENGCNFSMNDCLVAENRGGSGAGIDVIGKISSLITSLSCSNTVFVGNKATGSSGGAARFYQYACASLADCVIRGNTAAKSGGGVEIDDVATAFFDGCRFEGNVAESGSVNDAHGGGGLFIGGQTAAIRAYCSVSNCVFASNTSGTRAGGMGGTWNKCYFGGAIVNCVFTNNQSATQGGALVIRDADNPNPNPPIIRNCLFAFNRTTANGGSGDTTDANGGGLMFATYNDITLENCTIVSNSIGYTSKNVSGGIHHRYTGGKLKNCIVAFNMVNGQPENANSWTAGDNLYFNCCSDRAITRFTAANGCVIGDPKFADPAHGDFSLRYGSPCRNAGLDASWMAGARDLAGNMRIFGDRVDIGCYEFKPVQGLAIMIR